MIPLFPFSIRLLGKGENKDQLLTRYKIKSIVVAAFAGLSLVCAALASFGQTESARSSSGADVVERIMKESQGTIVIDLPPTIMNRLLENPVAPRKATPTGPQLRQGINKLAGYRVQVFSDGRNQTTLETRAKARGNIIVSKFPKYRGQVYTYSSSPNWYCRVGNFQTEHEASEALRELKRAFPAFGGEMRVVRSQIVIIK